MIVVYGTHRYGRDNRVDRHGVCQHCGKYGLLSTYDTREFFTIYWIPLIPLGRKHVVDACASCKKHLEMGLKEYRLQREGALGEAIAKMKGDPGSPERAAAALTTFTDYREVEKVDRMAPVLAEKHPGSDKVQFAAGAAYEMLGRLDLAETHFRKTVDLSNTPENREALASCLIYQAKLDQAREVLSHIGTGCSEEQAELLLLLAQAYQEQGDHEKARQILADVEEMAPVTAGKLQYQTFKMLTEPGRARPASAKPPPIRSAGARARKGLPTWVPSMTVPATVLVIAGVYFGMSYAAGFHESIWLVSGTEVPYFVTVNGDRYNMGAYGVKRIKVKEGKLVVKLVDTAFPIPEAEVNFSTRFFRRLFDSTTRVLNPDGLAVLVRETSVYLPTTQENTTENTYELYCGKVWHEFVGIDYPFKALPETITTEEGSGAVRKARLYNYSGESPADVTSAAMGEMQPAEMLGYTERRVCIAPLDSWSLTIFCSLGWADHRERVLKLLAAGRAHRPVLTEWHRRYQDLVRESQPDHGLQAEYAKLLESTPDERILMYLLGRVTDDEAEATRLYKAAEEGKTPVGYGYYAIAYNDLCLGRFKEALPFAKKAREVLGDAFGILHYDSLCLCALKRYDELLAETRAARKAAPLDGSLACSEAKYLGALGRVPEALKMRDEYVARLRAESNEAGARDFGVLIAAVAYYAAGDGQGYEKVLKSEKTGFAPYQLAVWNHDAMTLASLIAEWEDPQYDDYLLAFCLAMKAGSTELAEKMMSKAIGMLEKGGIHERMAAKMLRGDVDLARRELAGLGVQPYNKAILAASAGLALPELKAECFAIARKHNFDPVCPQRAVAAVVE